jgi:hypothetical protein
MHGSEGGEGENPSRPLSRLKHYFRNKIPLFHSVCQDHFRKKYFDSNNLYKFRDNYLGTSPGLALCLPMSIKYLSLR